MTSATWSDWALKRLAASRVFVGEVSLANATRILVVCIGNLALATILFSDIIWKVLPVGEAPTLVRVLSRLIGSLALAQGLTAAWMGLQTIRDLRASPVPYSGEYLRCLRRPLNEATDKFMDGTGIPPKYAIPVFLRKDGERDPHLFFAPLSFLNDLIALEAARKRGGVPRVRGAYLPHTHVIRDLSANNTMHQSVESFTSR